MPRRCDVELLYEVIDDGHKRNDGKEDWRRVRDDNQHRQRVEEHHYPKAHRHRQDVIDDVDVLGKSVEYAAERRCIEERHRQSHRVVEQFIVQITSRPEASDGEDDGCEEQG